MRDWKLRVPSGLLCAAVMLWAFTSVSAYHEPSPRPAQGWFQNKNIQVNALPAPVGGQGLIGDLLEGRRLFERETFGGNGRTCETCHSQDTGTVSPELLVLAVGTGSVFGSHVNDSGFWIFKEFFQISLKQTFLSWTVMEMLISILGLVGVMVLSMVI